MAFVFWHAWYEYQSVRQNHVRNSTFRRYIQDTSSNNSGRRKLKHNNRREGSCLATRTLKTTEWNLVSNQPSKLVWQRAGWNTYLLHIHGSCTRVRKIFREQKIQTDRTIFTLIYNYIHHSGDTLLLRNKWIEIFNEETRDERWAWSMLEDERSDWKRSTVVPAITEHVLCAYKRTCNDGTRVHTRRLL